MNILIIGGTKFVGRALVDAALARGHQLTLFNRGRTNPDLYPNVEIIQGDRDGQLNLLGDRSWDAVIDTCGYVPRVVGASAAALREKLGLYVFISTISVYAPSDEANRDEDAPLADQLEDPSAEEITGPTYGPLKVLSERAVMVAYPDSHLIIRPGLIVGPHDPTNRFTYWVTRMARGGRVLLPDALDTPVQFIDVRDLADWTLHLMEAGQRGIYNATGPAQRLHFGTVIDTAEAASGHAAERALLSEAFLLEQGLRPFTDLPLWLPAADAEAFNTISIARGLAAGLKFRPLAETVADTLAWARSLDEMPGVAGLSPEREAEVLSAWDAR